MRRWFDCVKIKSIHIWNDLVSVRCAFECRCNSNAMSNGDDNKGATTIIRAPSEAYMTYIWFSYKYVMPYHNRMSYKCTVNPLPPSDPTRTWRQEDNEKIADQRFYHKKKSVRQKMKCMKGSVLRCATNKKHLHNARILFFCGRKQITTMRLSSRCMRGVFDMMSVKNLFTTNGNACSFKRGLLPIFQINVSKIHSWQQITYLLKFNQIQCFCCVGSARKKSRRQ